MSETTEEQSPTYVAVTPRSGQQDRTAAGEQPDGGSHAQPRARTREATLPPLSAITERAQRLVSRRAAPEEGNRNLWRDGAESPAEVAAAVVVGPPGSEEWPRWRVVGWQLYLMLVGVPAAALCAGVATVTARPLRFAVAAALFTLLLLSMWGAS